MQYVTQEELFQKRQYPAGEGHSILNRGVIYDPASLVIEAHVRNFNDLCEVRVQDEILRRGHAVAKWFLPYFPYARQDRRETQDSGFELPLAMNLALGVDVVVADPHSDVAGIIPHITQTSVYQCMEATAGSYELDLQKMVVAIPDAGAAKKVYGWAAGSDRKIVQCLKKRDPATGKLSGFQVIADKVSLDDGSDAGSCGDLYGADVLILDDICDGGGTFIGLGELLFKEYQVKSLTLGITHGLFTQGLDKLSTVFDNIITFCPSHVPWESSRYFGNPKVIEIPFEKLYTNFAGEIL